jgi:MauM/NapG family ferredoxin protein
VSDEKPVNRRRFFREGFRELLGPLINAAAPLERAIEQIGKLDNIQRTPSTPRRMNLWLRPPGALDEQKFLDTCSRCGNCVSVCPAQCIKIDSTNVKGNGAPYIEPDAMACVVCEGLKCMHVCPTGALLPTPLGEIDMGTARMNYQTCVRSKGENCTICIDQCPIGSVAIELRDGRVHVIEDGCVGCGVCQHYCPTNPKSIVVIPKQN